MNVSEAKGVLQRVAGAVDPATAEELREIEGFLIIRDFEVETLKEQVRRMASERLRLKLDGRNVH